MARQKKVKIDGQEFTLQSVSPTWYMECNDRHGMTGSKKKTAAYMDEMFKNIVVEPKELNNEGMKYFDEREDLYTAERLFSEIEAFLRERA